LKALGDSTALIPKFFGAVVIVLLGSAVVVRVGFALIKPALVKPFDAMPTNGSAEPAGDTSLQQNTTAEV